MTEKIKSWWSDDRKWFCLLVNDGVNQATVSLTPDETTALVHAALRASGMGRRDREAIAAYLMARDEADYSRPIPDGLLRWGEACIASGKDAKHSGDCTKESHSCIRCITDQVLADADAILSLPALDGSPSAAVRVSDDPTPRAPASAAMRHCAEGGALDDRDDKVREALQAVWDDWATASDESGLADYEVKDVAPETVEQVKAVLYPAALQSQSVEGK